MLTAAAPPVNCDGFEVVVVALAVLLAARVVVTATGVVEAALVVALAELVLVVLLAATEEGVEGLMVIELAETVGVELGLTVLLLLRVTGTADEIEEEESLNVLVLRELMGAREPREEEPLEAIAAEGLRGRGKTTVRFEIEIERRAQTVRGGERGREACNESRMLLANDRSVLSEKATHSHARRIYTYPFHTLSLAF